MNVDYIIIQAGGKGTRLKHLTANKPKGIVPVNNLPIIFHLFRKYPKKQFIIIGDYKHEVLEEYLEAFCKVKYVTVKAEGVGTCAGLQKALEYIPAGNPFMLIWSDLIMGSELEIDNIDASDYVGLSKDFECRWSYENGVFQEKPSKEYGVAGMFIFQDKSHISDVLPEGEFVRWLSNKNLDFKTFDLTGTREIGTLLALQENDNGEYRCRPFNSMEVKDNIIIKRPVDEQGEKLAVRELNWYREVQKYDFEQIPKLYSLNPLTMEKINGKNIFRTNLSLDDKKKVIDNLVESLEKLHELAKAPADVFSIMDAYYHKTIKRLEGIRDLVPFADREFIRINGKNCRNPYFYKLQLRDRVKELLCDCGEFALIHGDCTFSNTMVDDDLNIIFLDPRGYFGFCELYGDVYYDWAKLYYSIYGDYDQFNNKHFSLKINENDVTLSIESNGWRDVADYFLQRIHNGNPDKIRLLHAIIWLSLTTYAWEDYDSICGAFYNGTYLLEDIL
jgi:GTP:adenosylcobinamide-phosphate guanylyltransferase